MSEKIKRFILIIFVTVIMAVAVLLGRSTIKSEKVYTVTSGPFELTIEVKGEIQGKNAVVINLPDELRRMDLRIYQLQIKDLVQEGTLVKKGEWVATLDAATITEQLQNNRQDLDRRQAELNDAKIDSAIQLTKLREELNEFQYDLEYKKIELEQAKYESPAYQRKQQVEFNKTLRQMDKKRRDYEIKKLELKTKTKRIENQFENYRKRDSLLKEGMAATRVTAPQEGMIMYARLWGGRKLRVGDQISIWMPTIATLPDMSVLVSETHIQEIDITKIAVGHAVDVTIDALPGTSYRGSISKVANVGQEIPGFDTKVFRVFIDLEDNNKEIKPAMTTNNIIRIESHSNVIKIPRKCLFTQNGDSFVFLQKANKTWKKKVMPGSENEEEVVIESGLNENEKILLTIPENVEQIPLFAEG